MRYLIGNDLITSKENIIVLSLCMCLPFINYATRCNIGILIILNGLRITMCSDDKNNSQSFYAILPIKRRSLIIGKMLYMYLMLLYVLLICSIAGLIGGHVIDSYLLDITLKVCILGSLYICFSFIFGAVEAEHFLWICILFLSLIFIKTSIGEDRQSFMLPVHAYNIYYGLLLIGAIGFTVITAYITGYYYDKMDI